MKTTFPVPFLAAISLATLHAQQSSEKYASAVVLVQFAPSDLVLNQPLLDAMAREPACRDDLKRVLGEALDSVRGIEVQLPAPHAAGTFQLHVYGNFNIRGPWSEPQQDAAMEAVIAHLQRRLDALLYDAPRRQLTKRNDELERRHAELLAERGTLLARIGAATNSATALQRQHEALEQQFVAARIDVATEERGRAHLDTLREEYLARREQYLSQLQVDRELPEVEALILRAEERLGHLRAGKKLPDEPNLGGTSAELVLQLTELRHRVAAHRAAASRLELAGQDIQRLLTVALEQVPASALALQRAQARLQSLEAERNRLAEQLAKAEGQRTQYARGEAQAERLDIDVTVCKALLTEVQGRLARLQPVRYELLRQR